MTVGKLLRGENDRSKRVLLRFLERMYRKPCRRCSNNGRLHNATTVEAVIVPGFGSFSLARPLTELASHIGTNATDR